jgi:hypothetical protein
MVEGSYIRDDLHKSRNQRLAFKEGFFVGGFRAGLMTISGGRLFGSRIAMHADAEAPRTVAPATPFVPDGRLTFSKVDAVFKSGNQTRDDIPTHLIVGQDVSGEVADLYAHMCPAGVYERQGDRLVLISVGGIETADDAWERITAGASLLQGYTGFVYGGGLWAKEIHDGIARRLHENGFDSGADAVGSAARQ